MVIYPVACDEHGHLVRIESYERGTPVFCLGCKQPMIGRQGDQNAWHFAHIVDAYALCSGESVLHRAAKLAIVEAHATTGLRAFHWTCVGCRTIRHYRIDDLTLKREDRPCENVQSDVLCRDSADVPRLAIEVVVAHSMETQTRERYLAMQLPVGIVKPTWNWIAELPFLQDLPFHERLDAMPCEECWWRRFSSTWSSITQQYGEECSRKITVWWSAWRFVWKEIWAEMNDAQQRLLERARKITTWWSAWRFVWKEIGIEMHDAQQRLLERWRAWCRIWLHIGTKRGDAWSYAWLAFWQNLGRAERDRAAQRQAAWLLLWQDLGKEEKRRFAQREDWQVAWQRGWRLVGACHYVRYGGSYRGRHYDPRWVYLEKYGWYLERADLDRRVTEVLQSCLPKEVRALALP
jgi:hypothetical protein